MRTMSPEGGGRQAGVGCPGAAPQSICRVTAFQGDRPQVSTGGPASQWELHQMTFSVWRRGQALFLEAVYEMQERTKQPQSCMSVKYELRPEGRNSLLFRSQLTGTLGYLQEF